MTTLSTSAPESATTSEQLRLAELAVIEDPDPFVDPVEERRLLDAHPEWETSLPACLGIDCTPDHRCADCQLRRRMLAWRIFQAKHGSWKHPSEANGDAKPPAGDGGNDQGKYLINMTDLGNARRVVHRHGKDLRYCHAWKTWLVWDGRRWRQDDAALATQRAKDTQGATLKEVLREMAELADDDSHEGKAAKGRCKKLVEHCLKWEGAERIRACLELARSEPHIPIVPGDLDKDGVLLNVHNGTLDLRTGRLREHRRQDLHTKLAPVVFDANAPCPLWLHFLDRVMRGNQALVGYLQRVVGYCLTGNVGEQCLWFLYGMGANGKSTFLSTILAMLGDYAIQAIPELLVQRHHEQHPTERADLFGRRFVATVETDEGKRLAESLLKQVTGGDKIRARHLHKDFFEFDPTHKIVLAANHKPAVRGTDHAVWRRIKLVPFTVTIPEEERDKELPRKLRAELPGIMAWAVRGCLEWQRSGLGEPEEVRSATNEYRVEQDSVASFLNECCVVNGEVRAKAAALLDSYQRFSGDRDMTATMFGRKLRERGFRDDRGTGGCRFWRGIGLLQSEE